MNNLYNKKSIREDEEEFHNHLEKIENIFKDCVKMDFRNDDEKSFHIGFPNIIEFLLEGEIGFFNHNNKRLEEKFYEISKLLCDKGIYPFKW